MYIVVLSNLFDQGVARTVILDSQFNIDSKGLMNEVSIVQKVVGFGMKPLNFSVVDNHVVDSCGKFTRFGKNDGQKSLVVVARLVSNGRVVGYRVVATNNGVVANLKLADLVAMCKAQNTPLTQNMMFRQGTLAEYPNGQIPTVELPKSQNERIRHQMPVQQSVIDYSSQQPQPVPTNQKRVDPPKSTQDIIRTMDNKQQREVKKAIDSGIDPALLADKRLSPQQMRVLWMSKQWGCKSEVFKDPNLRVDVMKFYADRLYTDDMCDKCKPILEHPELPLSEVSELYLCAMAGMDVNDLIGKSATEIQIAHENATRDYWCENKIFGDDPEYYEKALRVAMEEG